MPIYEYICQDCSHRFEAIVGASSRPECPSCKSAKLEKQFSVFGVATSDGAAARPRMGACGTCGDPRGPGSCSN